MERLRAPNEFFRIRRLREGMRAWEQLWRLLADGPHRLASREAAMAETPYTASSYLEGRGARPGGSTRGPVTAPWNSTSRPPAGPRPGGS